MNTRMDVRPSVGLSRVKTTDRDGSQTSTETRATCHRETDRMVSEFEYIVRPEHANRRAEGRLYADAARSPQDAGDHVDVPTLDR